MSARPRVRLVSLPELLSNCFLGEDFLVKFVVLLALELPDGSICDTESLEDCYE